MRKHLFINFLIFSRSNVFIFYPRKVLYLEIAHILQYKIGSLCRLIHFHFSKLDSIHIHQNNSGALIFLKCFELYFIYTDILGMLNEQSISRKNTM